MNLEILLKQERDYVLDHFNHDFALSFGLEVIDYIKKNQLKHVGIRIHYKGTLIFQYLMEDKKSDTWLKRKEKTVLETQHASYYTFLNKKNFSSWLENDQYAICGGGFPIIENHQVVGAMCISGLKHDEDHQLIIDTLNRLLGENV